MAQEREYPNPTAHFICGPNGAGKTTFANEFVPEFADDVPFLNADLIAQRLSPKDPERVSFQAGRMLLTQIAELSDRKESFAVETTLSGRSYVGEISRLKKIGYEINIYFISLPSPEVAMARVADRVQHGGHNVSKDIVKRRFDSGLNNFFSIYQTRATRWALFDGTEMPVIEIAYGASKELTISNEMKYNQLVRQVDRGQQINR